jgi:hypothetical protein
VIIIFIANFKNGNGKLFISIVPINFIRNVNSFTVIYLKFVEFIAINYLRKFKELCVYFVSFIKLLVYSKFIEVVIPTMHDLLV